MSLPDDPDLLARELNALQPARRPDTMTGLARLEHWLEVMVRNRAADLLLVAGLPPSLRLEDGIKRLDDGPLDGVDIEDAVLPALPPHARQLYEQAHIADGSLKLPGLGRFRVNLHRERGRAAAAIRALPVKIPPLDSLNLPAGVALITSIQHGLVLIGGATGSGKTTTLAALIGEINRHQSRHIITIEDPIEYEHAHARSIVEQVEIGIDAPDFPTALRAAVRQAPDVIVVGEMRDPETMRIALAAAETGHLVLSTIHTTDVASTVARIADGFPVERQNTIRQELAMGLSAVMTQTLLPRLGGGRIPAAELLVLGYGGRQHIRRNALQHLHQEITITRKTGSFTLEECLVGLVKGGLVDRHEAALRAGHLNDFESAMTAAGL
jgi:twitching motility protein PilT